MISSVYGKTQNGVFICCLYRVFAGISSLMLCLLGKNFSRQHFEFFFYFIFPENRNLGSSLHEMSILFPGQKKNKKNVIFVAR